MDKYFRTIANTLQALQDEQLADLLTLSKRTIERDGTIWIAGNGGSHAIAQHWACDLQKAGKVRATALGTNAAILTAWANDASYTVSLSSELIRLARPGDSLVCLSCSGTSPNIVAALRQAWLLRMDRALITRLPHLIVTPLDALVEVAAEDYGITEDVFGAIGHWLTNEVRA